MSTEYRLPKACSQYGASMGRPSSRGNQPPAHYGCKMSVARVRLDAGGYDNGGAYWGTGEPLWRAYAWSPKFDEEIELFFRAPDREAAKRMVREVFGYENVIFYR